MKTVKLEVKDPVLTQVNSKLAARLIKPALEFPAVFWREGPFGKKERKDYKRHVLFDLEEGIFFWTGLLPRVLSFCSKNKIPVEVQDITYDIQMAPPKIPGIKLRPDQIQIVEAAINAGRGLILAPTGTGKTVLQMALISALKDFNVLLLAHNLDIIQNTHESLLKHKFKNVQRIKNGKDKIDKDSRIIVSTIQSFSKLPADHTSELIDAIIIDEGHHLTKMKSRYTRTLSGLSAPLRWAFTATQHHDPEARIVCEGLTGPVVKSLSINEAVDLGILAKPKVILKKAPFKPSVAQIRKYPDVYDAGVVFNQEKNKMIMDIARENIASRNSVLILTKRLDHGNELLKFAKGMNVYYVRGETDEETRKKIKESLIAKDIMCVIATIVWQEGLDIPTLDCLINAAGGKSEIATMQSVGRALRSTDEKKRALIYDFFDPSHYYLIKHFGERVTLYFNEGWI